MRRKSKKPPCRKMVLRLPDFSPPQQLAALSVFGCLCRKTRSSAEDRSEN